MKPFLKWAGGKYRLLDELKKYFPADGKRFVEPFVGSGAVSLNVNYPVILAADVNDALIQTWEAIKTRQIEFINLSKTLFTPENNTPEAYAKFREEFNDPAFISHRPELFIYLNRHGFNGLCRFNKKGQFNVPFGKYHKPYFPENELLHVVEVAHRMDVVKSDFRNMFENIREGDIVYCDPPYVPLSATANFTAYSGESFTIDDQRELALRAFVAAERGATVIISNASTPITLELYKHAELHFVDVQRNISCKGETRGKAKEVIAVYKRK